MEEQFVSSEINHKRSDSVLRSYGTDAGDKLIAKWTQSMSGPALGCRRTTDTATQIQRRDSVPDHPLPVEPLFVCRRSLQRIVVPVDIWFVIRRRFMFNETRV